MKNRSSPIRKMITQDLPKVQALLEQLGYDLTMDDVERRFAAVAAEPDHILMVAEQGERPVGLVHAFIRPALEKPTEAVVQALVVERTQRRTGIGSRLMAAAERWAAERGFTSIVLASQVGREDAHAFYRKLGYDLVARSQVMRKRITPSGRN